LTSGPLVTDDAAMEQPRAARATVPGGRRRLLLGVGVAVAATLVAGTLGLVALKLLRRPPSSGYDLGPDQAFELRFLDHRGRRLSRWTGPLALMTDPFTVVRNFPSQRTPHFSIDEHGFRGGIARPSLPKVMLVGGSAAFGVGVGDGETITARLEAGLPRFSFVNAGVIGYVSGQELALVVHHLDRWRPAAYVAFDGWNDFVETTHGSQLRDHRVARPLGVNGEYYELVARLRARCVEAGECPANEPPRSTAPLPTAEQWAEAVLDTFVDNLERMHAFARGRGARFLAVLQPELLGKRRLSDAERSLGTDEQAGAAYRRFAARARAALTARGVPCLDLNVAADFVESRETLFLDQVHLSAQGNALVARAVQQALGSPGTTLPAGATP
jgi:hypothetical protein